MRHRRRGHFVKKCFVLSRQRRYRGDDQRHLLRNSHGHPSIPSRTQNSGQIGEALVVEGLTTLGNQAVALGLVRSAASFVIKQSKKELA